MATQSTLTPSAFAAKWKGVTTTEKAGSQSHFIDLCRMLGEPTPHEADPTGEHYAFEKRVTQLAEIPMTHDPGWRRRTRAGQQGGGVVDALERQGRRRPARARHPEVGLLGERGSRTELPPMGMTRAAEDGAAYQSNGDP